MPANQGIIAESSEIDGRLRALEEVHRATLNILEDFDEEKAKFQRVQQATMNLLEDFDVERQNLQRVQKATVNLLEDMHEERGRLGKTQRALLNILEDVEVERGKAEQANTLLGTVNKELEAFSYSVSHDLRAPLRAIAGFADAILEDYAPRLDDEGQKYFHLIRENAEKMGRLVDDLLTFSRLGRQELNEETIPMETLARSVFDDLAVETHGREIEFTVGPVPPARGDRAMIQQVLVNLLSNAVKFTSTKQKARVEFGYRTDEDGGAYYVKDNGVGFDMRYVGKLFGVFQRLHSVAEFEGTGIGLALVYRIIARHGGRAWAQGQLGKGATFCFTLPREKPS
ncbi:MAG TPA: ATP-binding protein [Thermoguttaceae bacterium]|nr:ATP-binding protein [Thermoguttaceae bacterium]